MAKIIVFSNLKGGVGKSTLCCHFAHFLVAKNQKVAVLDADLSHNIYNLRQRELAKVKDAVKPWEVWTLDAAASTDAVIERAKTLPGYVLIDCPGTLNDPALLKVFQAADAAVIPFRYDDFMIDSTFTFTKVLMKEAPQAKKIYVPNIIKMGVRYALQDSATEMFSRAGVVTFRVKDGVAIQRLSTLYAQDQYQEAATAGAFNAIYEVVR